MYLLPQKKIVNQRYIVSRSFNNQGILDLIQYIELEVRIQFELANIYLAAED